MSMQEQGKLPYIVWIAGDRLLAQERWRALVGDAEIVRIDGRSLSIGALAGEIDTLPMFVDHKWILVQDFRLPEKKGAAEPKGERASPGSSKRGSPDSDPSRQLTAALERIGPSCTVILVSDEGDRRTRLFKLVEERGRYIELPSFRDYETPRMAEWVSTRLGERGKRIPNNLALEFVNSVGSDVGILASEADKLAIAMGDDIVVTDAHMSVVAGSPVALRRLIDEGIMRKQPARAEALLEQVLAGNENPLKILNFIIPRIRDLLRARLLPEGKSDPQAAVLVFGHMHPFRLKNLYAEAERFSARELRCALHSLVLADTCLKSSADPSRVLCLLVSALSGGISHAAFAHVVQSYVEPWD